MQVESAQSAVQIALPDCFGSGLPADMMMRNNQPRCAIMKVYACPQAVEFEGNDYSNYDYNREAKKVENHKTALKNWLTQAGYAGQHTGKIATFPVADGNAQYMVGDKGRSIILIHLPYWDGYHYPYIERLTRADVMESIKRNEGLAALFGQRTTAEPEKQATRTGQRMR